MKSKISITLDESIVKGVDNYIDGINIRNRSQAIEFFLSKHIRQNRTAVILSSKIDEFRILSKIKSKPIIVHTIKTLQSYNFKKIFIVGEKALLSKIFAVLGTGKDYMMDIEYIEDSVPKGSAASLQLLKNKIDSSFIVIPADNYLETDLNSFWSFHSKANKLVNLAITASSNPTRLGVVELQGNTIVRFEQKPKKSTSYLVWTGIMMCEPDILFYDCESIEKELIPKLIKTKGLGGFILSGKWKNIHTKKDVQSINL